MADSVTPARQKMQTTLCGAGDRASVQRPPPPRSVWRQYLPVAFSWLWQPTKKKTHLTQIHTCWGSSPRLQLATDAVVHPRLVFPHLSSQIVWENQPAPSNYHFSSPHGRGTVSYSWPCLISVLGWLENAFLYCFASQLQTRFVPWLCKYVHQLTAVSINISW